MKINENLYECDWCGELINQNVGKSPAMNKQGTKSPGRHTMVNQLGCPKCGRLVSQKTKFELINK